MKIIISNKNILRIGSELILPDTAKGIVLYNDCEGEHRYLVQKDKGEVIYVSESDISSIVIDTGDFSGIKNYIKKVDLICIHNFNSRGWNIIGKFLGYKEILSDCIRIDFYKGSLIINKEGDIEYRYTIGESTYQSINSIVEVMSQKLSNKIKIVINDKKKIRSGSRLILRSGERVKVTKIEGPNFFYKDDYQVRSVNSNEVDDYILIEDRYDIDEVKRILEKYYRKKDKITLINNELNFNYIIEYDQTITARDEESKILYTKGLNPLSVNLETIKNDYLDINLMCNIINEIRFSTKNEKNLLKK